MSIITRKWQEMMMLNEIRLALKVKGLWFGTASAIYASCMALYLSTFVHYLDFGDTYNDFISSKLAIEGSSKTIDFFQFALFLLLLPVIYLLISIVHKVYERASQGKVNCDSTNRVILFSFIPATIYAISLVFSNSPDSLLSRLHHAGSWLFLFPIIILATIKVRSTLTDRTFKLISLQLLLGIVFSLFSGFGIHVVLSHFGMYPPNAPAFFAAVPGLVIALLFIAYAYSRSSSRKRATLLLKDLKSSLVVTQFGVPLLLLKLRPLPLYFSAQNSFVEPLVSSSFILDAIIIFSIVALYSVLIIRFLRVAKGIHLAIPGYRQKKQPYIIILLIPVALTFMGGPQPAPVIPEDWFHNAERWLPMQQLLEHGKIPYTDYYPVQGLSNYYHGFINLLVFDSDPQYLQFSMFLFEALFITVLIFLVGRNWGFWPALIVSLVPAITYKAFALVLVVIIFASPRLFRRTERWLLYWLLIIPFAFTYNPTMGVAALLATVPIAIIQAVRMVKRKMNIIPHLVVVSSFILLIMLTPLGGMLSGYVTFLYENGISNTVGHGISLEQAFNNFSQNGAALDSVVIFNSVRFLWIGVLIALPMAAIYLKRRRDNRTFSNAWPWLLVSTLAILFFGYWSLNRIDIISASRPWQVSIFAVGIVAAVTTYILGGFRRQRIVLGFVATASLLFNLGSPERAWLSLESVSSKLLYRVVPSQYSEYLDGQEVPENVRGLFTKPFIKDHIIAFEKVLESSGGKDTTYFDFTDTPLRYYVHNKPVPTRYAAYFNAVNLLQQREMIRQLDVQRIPLAVISPLFYSKDVSPSLRCIYLYKYLALNYYPIRYGDFTLMLRKELMDIPDEQLSLEDSSGLLEAVYHIDHLGTLPLTWGSSWDTLQALVRPVVEVDSQKSRMGVSDESLVLFTSGDSDKIGGADIDIIMLDLEMVGDQFDLSEELSISWKDAEGAEHSLAFEAHTGTHIIPVSSDPKWLFSQTIVQIKLLRTSRVMPLSINVKAMNLFSFKE